MKNSFAPLALLLLVAAASAFAEPPLSHHDRYAIGMVLPLSGPAADYGQAIVNSIELAKRDRPELFEKIDVRLENVPYDAKAAVTAFQKLVEIDHVDLIYAWGIVYCKALAPLAEAAGVILAAQCIDPTIGVNRPHVLRFMNYTDQYLEKTVDYLEHQGHRKLGVLLADNSYQEEMFLALQRALRPGQTATLVDRVPPHQMDFRPYLARLRGKDFDALGVFLMMGQTAQFFVQAREQHLNLPAFGTNVFESVTEVKAARGAMEGALFANNLVYAPYITRYQSEFGPPSQLSFGAPAYEFATLLGELVTASPKKLSPPELLAAFAAAPRREGKAAGPYQFRDTSTAGKFFEFPLVMKRVHGEGFEVLAE